MTASTPTKTSPRSWKRYWPWVVGILLLVVGASIYSQKREKPIPITFSRVTQRDITQIVSATGKIQPALEVKISAEVAGEIIDLPYQEGQAVKKGDLLVKIKPDVYQAQVEQQEAALDAARADNLQRKAQLLKAEQDVRRQRELFTKKISSQTDLDDAETNRAVADASFQASLFDIKRVEGQLSQIRQELTKTSIFSPIDGSLSALTSKLGERVVATAQFAGTEILRVANLDDMEVNAKVNENDVVHIQVDHPAVIRIDAYPDRTFVGSVKHIASTATVTGTGTSEEVTNYEVKIRIIEPGVPLRPGMSATTDIQTATVRDVLAVPIQSVTVRTRNDGESLDALQKKRDLEEKETGSITAQSSLGERDNLQRVVFLKKGNRAEQRPVTTGLSDNAWLEIKSGLAANDEVITGTYSAISRDLKNDSPVTLEKPKKSRP